LGKATTDTNGHGLATTDTWGETTYGLSWPPDGIGSVSEVAHVETRRARPYPPETIALARRFGVRL